MVEKHIKHLLFNHDCVIIPEFGGLITRYVPARINPVKHTLAPPSRKIAFNEKLILNDGLLISTIAHANSISNEEAKQLVTSFVHNARTRLNGENRFELADIGVFRYNAERHLEFEYIEAENMLEASFGLPEIIARPIRHEEPAVLRTLLKERQSEPVPTKQPLRRRLKRAYNVAAGLALTGLLGAGLYMLSLQTDYNISSLNPITLFHADKPAADAQEPNVAGLSAIPAIQSEIAYDETQAPGISEAAAWVESASNGTSEQVPQYAAEESVIHDEIAKVEDAALSTVVSGKDGRFYIITGGYARMHNAEYSRQEIAEDGHLAKVLEPGRGSRLFKVSVADFATADEAQAAMNTYRKSFGETIWVYNN